MATAGAWIVSLSALALSACAQPAVEWTEDCESGLCDLYGLDDRRDIYQLPDDDPGRVAAIHTAAIVHRTQVVAEGQSVRLAADAMGVFTLSDRVQHYEGFPLCEREVFGYQPALAQGSGFLLDSTRLVTARHVAEMDCANMAVVFDYAYTRYSADPTRLHPSQVRYCQRVEASEQHDVAIVHLDQAVEGRVGLMLGDDSKLSVGSPVWMVGHPSGLPTKVADGAVLDVSDPLPWRDKLRPSSFLTNLDAFGGNSGSAVLNATGAVVGILVAGGLDYDLRGGWDSQDACLAARRCPEDGSGCDGNVVLRASAITELLAAEP